MQRCHHYLLNTNFLRDETELLFFPLTLKQFIFSNKFRFYSFGLPPYAHKLDQIRALFVVRQFLNRKLSLRGRNAKTLLLVEIETFKRGTKLWNQHFKGFEDTFFKLKIDIRSAKQFIFHISNVQNYELKQWLFWLSIILKTKLKLF